VTALAMGTRAGASNVATPTTSGGVSRTSEDRVVVVVVVVDGHRAAADGPISGGRAA
jgi:hypothetical protein